MHTRDEIRAAYARIAPHVRRTPTLAVAGEDFGLGAFEIVFKLEFMQRAGVFKTRGAFTNLLLREVPSVGVVAASGGNHGAAVAYAAKRLGLPAHIFVPTISSPVKIDRVRSYGAELHVVGDRYAGALAASRHFAAETGALEVHAFDQAETILGTSTVGLEVSEQVESFEKIVCAIGGGGLLAGLATYFREDASVAVVGVEPTLAPTLTDALAAGHPVDSMQGSIAADSLAPARIGELVFPLARDHVAEVALVSDEQIRAAQVALWEVCRIVVEPGAATAFAGVLSGVVTVPAGGRIVVVLSGANVVGVGF
jgi:threonine dehydratase